MVHMIEVGMANRLMAAHATHDGGERVDDGYACDGERNEHHDEALRAHDTLDRHDAEHEA